MTKANGRGRGWRKKTWETLAPSTKKKYERYGITSDDYASGVTVGVVDSWLRKQERTYGWEKEEGRTYSMTVNGTTYEQSLSELDKRKLIDGIRVQKQMEAAYENGDVEGAQRMWASRDPELPDWMMFYHGAFS
jgi:hypothetical protein